jgi:hypothetical protein
LIGAAADDDIGRAGVVRRWALDEGDPARQTPFLGVLPAAGEIRAMDVDVDTDSACLGRGFQDPQQQLTPSAAIVNDVRGPASGQVGGEPVSALAGKRPVERQSSTRAEAEEISHKSSP